jgi:hypothetical protein
MKSNGPVVSTLKLHTCIDSETSQVQIKQLIEVRGYDMTTLLGQDYPTPHGVEIDEYGAMVGGNSMTCFHQHSFCLV